MTRIAIIGAGSLVFSSRLTADILTYPHLRDAHFALVDVDPERLAYAGRIVERICRDGGYADASYSLHQDRAQRLAGADYVIISILVGGYDAIETRDRHTAPLRRRSGDRRYADARRHHAMPAHPSTVVGDRPRHHGALSGRLGAQLHQSDGDVVLGDERSRCRVFASSVCAIPYSTRRAMGASLESCHSTEVDFECAGLEPPGVDRAVRASRPRSAATPFASSRSNPRLWRKDTSRMEYVKHFGYPVTEASGHNSEYSAWFRKRPELIEAYCPGGSWNGGSRLHQGAVQPARLARGDGEDGRRHRAGIDLERSNEYGSQIVSALAGGDAGENLRQRDECGVHREPARRRLRRSALPGRPRGIAAVAGR